MTIFWKHEHSWRTVSEIGCCCTVLSSKMRSSSPQPRTSVPKPQAQAVKAKSGIPRCADDSQQRPASATPSSEAEDMDVYSENQLLGRLLQDMQAKLSTSSAEGKQLSEDARRRDIAMKGLQGQLERCRGQIQDLQRENEALRATNASLAEQHDRAQAEKTQLQGAVVDLTLQLKNRDGSAAQLQERCKELEQQLQQLRASGVTAEHFSQQLQRVEAVYRSRLDAVKEDCREKLVAQEAAARARLAEAQAATAQMMSGVKRAAVREVQRAEGLLEGKVMDQLRVLDQLAKRCRALEARTADMRPLAAAANKARARVAELERRLQEAEEAAAAAAMSGGGCCCCCHNCAAEQNDSAAELEGELAAVQQRLAAVRGEAVEQAELVAQLQSELVTAQHARVAAEERLEAAEATCRELRTDNVALRTQLLAAAAPNAGRRGDTSAPEGWHNGGPQSSGAAGDRAAAAASREREAAAHAAALRAAEADAASREMLQQARREQVAASLALLSQLRRMQALECMRLNDLQEIHDLERRLAVVRRESAQPG